MAFHGALRPSPNRPALLLLAVLLLPCIPAFLWLSAQSEQARPRSFKESRLHCHGEIHQLFSESDPDKDGRPISAPSEHFQHFQHWMTAWGSAKPPGADALANGIEIATERRKELLTLMAVDPEQALQLTLDWDEHQRLPKEIQALCETPFSMRGDFMVFPGCGVGRAPGKQRKTFELRLGGRSYRTTAFGRRLRMGSKDATPLQGILLDDLAVVRPSALQRLTSSEVSAIREDFPIANKDQTRDVLSGELIPGEPVVALGGGLLFFFAHEEGLHATNERLASLDEVSGPHTGARQVFQLAASGSRESDIPETGTAPPPNPSPAPAGQLRRSRSSTSGSTSPTTSEHPLPRAHSRTS